MRLRDLLEDQEEEDSSYGVDDTPNEENLPVKREQTPEIEQIFILTENNKTNLEPEQKPQRKPRTVIHKNYVEIFCEFCEKGFISKSNYISHLLSHSDERNFCCDICGKKSKTKSDLKKHKNTHLPKEERPSKKCEICLKIFMTSKNCKNHMKTHTGETPFECQICNKTFSRNSSLSRHKLVHTRVRRFKCEICKKHFARKEYLKIHSKVHETKAKEFN